jgi:hypothetical protein
MFCAGYCQYTAVEGIQARFDLYMSAGGLQLVMHIQSLGIHHIPPLLFFHIFNVQPV